MYISLRNPWGNRFVLYSLLTLISLRNPWELDVQDPGNRQQVSAITATVAMILNGLGFSNG